MVTVDNRFDKNAPPHIGPEHPQEDVPTLLPTQGRDIPLRVSWRLCKNCGSPIIYCNACIIFSGVIGKLRMRIPRASSMALAMAGPMQFVGTSPADFAPKGPVYS